MELRLHLVFRAGRGRLELADFLLPSDDTALVAACQLGYHMFGPGEFARVLRRFREALVCPYRTLDEQGLTEELRRVVSEEIIRLYRHRPFIDLASRLCSEAERNDELPIRLRDLLVYV